MDGLKFMGEMGASMMQEKIANAAQQARDAAERARQEAEAAAARMQSKAEELSTSCKNLDLTKIDVQAYGEHLRKSSTEAVRQYFIVHINRLCE